MAYSRPNSEIRIDKLFRTYVLDLKIKRGRLVEHRNLLESLRYMCLYFPFMRFLTLLSITRKYVPGVKITTEIFGISELITAPY